MSALVILKRRAACFRTKMLGGENFVRINFREETVTISLWKNRTIFGVGKKGRGRSRSRRGRCCKAVEGDWVIGSRCCKTFAVKKLSFGVRWKFWAISSASEVCLIVLLDWRFLSYIGSLRGNWKLQRRVNAKIIFTRLIPVTQMKNGLPKSLRPIGTPKKVFPTRRHPSD
jgi:hypothetical protein